VTLDKQYKAIKAPSSKFHKPFKQAAYRVSTGKKSKEERIAEETIHGENQRNASRLFEECVVLHGIVFVGCNKPEFGDLKEEKM